jgi:uncharacterized protein (DUF1800 family)
LGREIAVGSNEGSLAAAVAVTRFGLGARPGEIADAAPDPHSWLITQIRPEGAHQPEGQWPDAPNRLAALIGFRDQVRAIRASFGLPSPGAPRPAAPEAADLQREFQAARRAARQPLDDSMLAEILARAQLAATTRAGFRERWTLFWSNHFTVGRKNEATAILAPVFEREAIRPRVFGRFTDLLVAAVTHQAMLHYLDQVHSAGPDSPAGQRRALGLNENLAREVMELHTVGPDSGYTQADVTEFARALTGYSIAGLHNANPLGAPLFRAGFHEPGPRTVMGRTYQGDGADQARAILADLAENPATARHLARKIGAHFVADTPSPALAARLESAYLASGGDLARVAEALIAAPEAWDPVPAKLKTPYEFIVSGWRAADQQPGDARKDLIGPLTGLGMRPFAAPQPNGWPDEAEAWGAPDALIKRLYWSQAFADVHAAFDDPVEAARQALGARLTPAAARAISRAESRPEAFALLLMLPEFQRR